MGKSMPSKQNSENTYPVNWFTPKRKQQRGKRRRDTLDAGQLALLTALEERNAVLLAQRVNPKAFPIRPRVAERSTAYTWEGGMRRLTIQRQRPHNAHALEASRAGSRNPNDIGALAPCWAFFYAQNPSMAAWAGHGSSMAGSYVPVFDPLPSRHPISVETDCGGSIQHIGAIQ